MGLPFRLTQHGVAPRLTQLDRLWPGALVNVKRFRARHPTLAAPVPLLRSKPLERARLRAILQHAPNPYAWPSLSEAQIQAFLRTHVGRGGPKTAARIAAVVQRALLPPPELATLLAERLQADFRRYLDLEATLAQMQQQAEALVPAGPEACHGCEPGRVCLPLGRRLAPFLFKSAAFHG